MSMQRNLSLWKLVFSLPDFSSHCSNEQSLLFILELICEDFQL